ncbi:MAG: hypothetical protein ACRD0H_14565, partial [Actinomycetes bacterium]
LYDDQGSPVIDPDEEVAAAIRDVFAAFAAAGSAYQVVAAFAWRRFPLRAMAVRGPVSCVGGGSTTPGCWAS